MRRLAVAAFVYTWLVFGATFAISSVQTGVKPYYISGLLNSGEDTVGEWVARWLLWGSLPVVLYPFVVHRDVPRPLAIFLAFSWYFAIVSGVHPRVFGGPPTPDWLAYTHYGATGVVLLAASLTVLSLYRVLGAIWIVTSIAYGTLFLVSRFTDALDLPSELFIASEYVYYATFGILLLLLVPAELPEVADAAPVVTVVTVRDRERALAQRHR